MATGGELCHIHSQSVIFHSLLMTAGGAATLVSYMLHTQRGRITRQISWQEEGSKGHGMPLEFLVSDYTCISLHTCPASRQTCQACKPTDSNENTKQ